MKQYLDIVRHVLENGKEKRPVRRKPDGSWEPVDSGVMTLACPNVLFSHNMSDGFPLLTTKKMAWKNIRVELEGFINAITDKKWYQDRNCVFWNQWSNPLGVPSWWDQEKKKEHQLKDTDLGAIYGWNWRHFNKPYSATPRIMEDLEPTVCGVAAYGSPKNKEFADKMYATWTAMIRRCYVEKDKDYQRYGGKGVYIVNRWLVFDKFLEDAICLHGWDEKLKDWDAYTLDKDYYGHNCYGPNSCRWASSKEQGKIKSSIKSFYAMDNLGLTYIGHEIKEFAKEWGLDPYGISHCLSGKQKKHKGWTFWRDQPNEPQPVDQLASIVETLQNNPMDRRMLCSAWNPNQLHMQALPPCHYSWGCTVIDDELHLHWEQRSCDLMLGAPANIASYGLLLCLLAEVGGFKRGNLSGVLVDCHIYENQIEAAKEQITREPRPLPYLDIMRGSAKFEFDIFNWTHKDVILKGYDPLEKIDFGKVTV